jgi:hypothetical protein
MKIDFKKLVILLLPTFLRKSVWLHILQSAVLSLQKIHSHYEAFKSAKLYELTITPQVCYLEKVLNETICPGEYRITITDAEQKEIPYFFRATDNKDVYFSNSSILQVYFFRLDAHNYAESFIVNVPTFYGTKEPQVRALLNKYKLLSKTYKINYI